MQVAVESRKKEPASDKSIKFENMGGETQFDKLDTNLKFVYELDTEGQNYDVNAVEHRVKQHVLKSEIVDTCGSATDSTFASIEVPVQPNYAIGVFKD